MNAEGFSVPGPLVLNSSFCSSRLLRKDFRIRNTTSPVTTRSPTPSPAVIIQRCCVLFPACSVPNMISAFSFARFRSEERRVGKECRYQRCTYNKQKDQHG